MDDELQKWRKEHNEEMVRQREESQKEVDELKRKLAEANTKIEEKAELEKKLVEKDNPQPEKGEKCNVLTHALLENQIADLKKELEKRGKIIDDLLARDIDEG
ncbi:13860_t:CDS:1 [Cetraspora pellucida]|uniref:13860_t:CDS:1 n=1 Tax=Cetraspora pellucida TaxID=1433469 RepID=A0ACA9MQE9_9GLOM|nr:13860_t:CDS:1 [Cetraspora pellucida]